MSINMCLCAQEVTDHTLMDLFARNGRQKTFESRRIVAKWATIVLGPTEAQWQPPWRPRVGPKLPLSPLRAKAFAYSPLPCWFPRSWMGQCCSPSPKKKQTDKWKSCSQKGLFFPVRLSADHFGLLRLCRSSLGSALPFHFQAAYYPLYHDITSTQTSSLCLSSNRRVLY